MFQKRTLVIATKHKKENAIAPLLLREFEINAFVPEHFDSDLLGTFSGEIERKNDPITTVREKCLMAMKLSGCDLGIANEGSFGPHPTIFFANANEEFIILIDKKNDLEIIEKEISIETNFDKSTINNYEELLTFAKNNKFPSHAIILKKEKHFANECDKGIQSWKTLEDRYNVLSGDGDPLIAETDMRALYNPTRMEVIKKVTEKLITKMKSCCPKCNTPGFGIVSAKPGLPCEWCKSATKSIKSVLYQCQKCNYELEEANPNNKLLEDPMYCDYCNP